MDELAAILNDRPTLNQYLATFRRMGEAAATEWLTSYWPAPISPETIAELANWYQGSTAAGQQMQHDPGAGPDLASVPFDPTLPNQFRYRIIARFDQAGSRAPVFRTVYINSDIAFSQEALFEDIYDLLEEELGELMPSPAGINEDEPFTITGVVNAVWQR